MGIFGRLFWLRRFLRIPGVGRMATVVRPVWSSGR